MPPTQSCFVLAAPLSANPIKCPTLITRLSSFLATPNRQILLRRRPKLRPCPRSSATPSPTPASTPEPVLVPTTTPKTALSTLRTATHQLASLFILLGVQRAVARLLIAFNLSFPAPLAAMLLVFATIVAARLLRLSRPLDSVTAALFTPGVAFLTRWLAVFFVPNLVMLPLAPALPPADLPKIAAILVPGFLFSLLSSAFFCIALRTLVRAISGKAPPEAPPSSVVATPPSNALIAALTISVATMLAISYSTADVTALPAKLYALFATVLTFSVGQRFPKKVKMLLHPLITCTIGTIAAMALLGTVTGSGFSLTLATYYLRQSGGWGGGNVLAALLGPAVITFAFTMDAQRKLALGRIVEVVGTSLAATLSGLFGTAFAARLLGMSPPSRLLVIPRMITAPLAVAIAELLGANVGLAASVVALTGLLGANIGASVLSVLKVRDPVVRGLAVGASAHGLGTAAMSSEGSAFPFAALAMTLVGIFSTVLVAYAPFRVLLLRVALGKGLLQAPVVQ